MSLGKTLGKMVLGPVPQLLAGKSVGDIARSGGLGLPGLALAKKKKKAETPAAGAPPAPAAPLEKTMACGGRTMAKGGKSFADGGGVKFESKEVVQDTSKADRSADDAANAARAKRLAARSAPATKARTPSGQRKTTGSAPTVKAAATAVSTTPVVKPAAKPAEKPNSIPTNFKDREAYWAGRKPETPAKPATNTFNPKGDATQEAHDNKFLGRGRETPARANTPMYNAKGAAAQTAHDKQFTRVAAASDKPKQFGGTPNAPNTKDLRDPAFRGHAKGGAVGMAKGGDVKKENPFAKGNPFLKSKKGKKASTFGKKENPFSAGKPSAITDKPNPFAKVKGSKKSGGSTAKGKPFAKGGAIDGCASRGKTKAKRST